MSNERRKQSAPTRAQLLERIAQLEKEKLELSTYETFGCLSRQGLNLATRDLDLTPLAVVYWDVDRLKRANERWGKPVTSDKIAQSLAAHRSTDCITIAGQAFSGDEFCAFPLWEEAEAFAIRIQHVLHLEEMSATFAIFAPVGTAQECMAQGEKLCSSAKDAGIRDAILDYR